MNVDPILTIEEVANDLRCSKAHVYKCINGKVAGVAPMPSIPMGRRKLVRRSALERWKRMSERGGVIVDEVAEGNAVLTHTPGGLRCVDGSIRNRE